MNLLFINGSPRQEGNTSLLLQKMQEGAAQKNTSPSIYHLGRLRIRGCVGCMVCNEAPICAVRDQMQDLYAEIQKADTLIFGFPIYMGQMPSFAKAFTDRLYAFLNPDLTSRFPTPKQVFWLITQSSPDLAQWQSYLTKTAHIFRMIGFETIDTWIVPSLIPARENTVSSALLELAVRKGNEL